MIRFLLATIVVGLLLGVRMSNGQEATAPNDSASAEADEAAELALAEVERWNLRLDRATEPLALIKKPVLRWTNPHVGRVYGSVFLWTADGRPQVVASVFKWYSPRDDHYFEAKSLAGDRLNASRGGLSKWRSRAADLEWSVLSDAAAPRESRRERLQQMRQLARDFSGELIDRRNGDDGRRVQLRLLTQPIYRYEGVKPPTVDGALFAFVQGTDPEILLLLEARAHGARRQWHYAVARLNTDTLTVRHDAREVWKADDINFSSKREDDDYVLFKISADQAQR